MLKQLKPAYYRNTCISMFIMTPLIITKVPSIDKWIKKAWCIYTMENYSAIQKMNSVTHRKIDGYGSHHVE